MGLKLITAPTVEPVTLAEAKAQCRIDTNTEDALVTLLISAARESAEHITERALLPQTWELTLDAFPSAIQLAKLPVISITTLKYLDAAGVLQILATSQYQLDSSSEQEAWLVPMINLDWPETNDDINAVRVRYQAGYADAASVPSGIKSWILMLVNSLYENRELDAAQIIERSPALSGMLDRYRVWSF